MRIRRFGNTKPNKLNTKVPTIAKLAPLTAVRCDSPAVLISSENFALCNDVSPIMSPGSNEAESPPMALASLRKLIRIFSSDSSTRGDSPMITEPSFPLKLTEIPRSLLEKNRPEILNSVPG